MARKAATSKSSEKPKLSYHLFLCSYMHRLFGANSFDELKRRVDKVRDGYDDEGRSYMFQTLVSMKGVDPLVLDKLEEYDQNIRSYINRINANRPDKMTLKYFQYLAVLYTEIFLDRYFQDSGALGEAIYSHAIATFNDFDANYMDEKDLGKLAYMMATGSGKTLIMHINLLQFQRYNTGQHKLEFDNILLITPNESMSRQHISELRLSGIPAELYNGNGRWFSSFVESDSVKVVDINKFTKEKKGSQGVSVDVEQFGGKNLLLVDEGHKGVTSGDAWVNYRDQLSEKGFTFEYSATFSQAVAASKAGESDKLLHAYGKSIIFDYSYKYFYSDGYGKDYLIMNLKKDAYDGEMKHVLMMGNLLTFYEQKLLYDRLGGEVKPYNIKSPLWIFVGSKVSGERQQSDVFEIIRFINRVLSNENGWATKTIANILNERSGLKDKQGHDVFARNYPERRLSYLCKTNSAPSDIYKDLLKLVFHAVSPAPLHLLNLKGAESEIGMRCGNGDYFGLIRVSDDAGLIKLVNRNLPDVKTDDDSISNSLFTSIDRPGSSLNLLVGAKMFMEGWNSWRVSCMGLMNLGKTEGVQIIQMFGRGVRLKGKNMTLKRSSALDGVHPKHLPALETLNVFGIEADYMDIFMDTIGVEGLAAGKVTFDVPIKVNKDLLSQKLHVPDVDKNRYYKEEMTLLVLTDNVSVTVDLTPIVELLEQDDETGISSESGSTIAHIRPELIELMDWEKIYLRLLEYRIERGWNNIIFHRDTLKAIIKDERYYTLKCPADYVNPLFFTDMARLESVIITVLKKYLDKYYNYRKNDWVKKNLEMTDLTAESGNFDFTYQVKVADNAVQLKEMIEKQVIDNLGKLYTSTGSDVLMNVFFDRHLYQPLLALGGLNTGIIEIHPQGLNDGEKHFITNLKQYVDAHKGELVNTRLFVLRNLPKRGIGFFELTNYYPDFIVWIFKDNMQHIAFIDPKGLARMFNGFEEEEITLYLGIKTIEERLKALQQFNNITLDSFIVSVTPKAEADKIFRKGRNLSLNDYLVHHVVFEEDPDHIKRLFNTIVGIQ